MTLFIQAANIHVGGGKTLLLPLLQALRGPATIYIDERLTDLPELADDVTVIRVKPTFLGRLTGERDLSRATAPGDVVLCFGNLPPLFPNKAKVFIYLQNRYLVESLSTAGLPLPVRVRISGERMLLRACMRSAQLVVQTRTMAAAANAKFGRTARVMGFVPELPTTSQGAATPRYDYVYVASGEVHKNHRRLVESWLHLAERDIRPSLCLTLTEQRDADLWHWINETATQNRLNIHFCAVSSPEQVANLLAESGALVFPSLFESFGIPLLEAQRAGLSVLAPERDYVRDMLSPAQTFDPLSSISIARAVMRHLGKPEQLAPILEPDAFLSQIQKEG